MEARLRYWAGEHMSVSCELPVARVCSLSFLLTLTVSGRPGGAAQQISAEGQSRDRSWAYRHVEGTSSKYVTQRCLTPTLADLSSFQECLSSLRVNWWK